MVFSSITFLLYFLPIFLAVYFVIDKKYKNAFILIASIFFYAWGAPKFIFVILLTTFIDFHLVKWMDSTNTNFKRKALLILSVGMNLGLLLYFKYSNFFIENVNSALSLFTVKQIHWTKLILPIGISFYTFETITYVVDVYRREHKPLTKFWDYQLYIILFPKLIAGPIIRYHELADQISDRSNWENNDNRLTGFYRFCLGLAKKVLIANQMGIVADEIFNSNYSELGTATAWIGSIAYTFQIYFDFSGYSDMAIGLGKIMGFKFPENFNNPYISQSITEFWRRWHITLGNWMRNYLYIPLGGNRVNSKYKLYFNLIIVFIASGFWHGASWSFIFWGAYHGFFLIMERAFLSKLLIRVGKLPSILFTFLVVNIGWIFFRIEHFKDALQFVKHLFIPYQFATIPLGADFYLFFALATIFSFFCYSKFAQNIQNKIYDKPFTNLLHISFTVISMLLFILSVCSITDSGFNPFIYFRF